MDNYSLGQNNLEISKFADSSLPENRDSVGGRPQSRYSHYFAIISRLKEQSGIMGL
jgi:hypothetical protein